MPGNMREPDAITASTPGAIPVYSVGRSGNEYVSGYRRPTIAERATARADAQYQAAYDALSPAIKTAIAAGQLAPVYSTTSVIDPNTRAGEREVRTGITGFTSPGANDTTYTYDIAGNKTGQYQNQHDSGGFFGGLFSGLGDLVGGAVNEVSGFVNHVGDVVSHDPVAQAAAAIALAYATGGASLGAEAGAAGATTLGAAEGALTAAEIAAIPGGAEALTAAATVIEAGGTLAEATTAAGEAAGLGSLAAEVGGNAAALTNAGMSGAVPEGLASLGSTVTPGIVEAAAPTAVNAGATSVNQMIAAGTAPGSVGAAGAASGALSGTELAAAQGLVTAGATPALVTAAEQGAQNYIDSGGAALSGQGGGPNGTNIFTQQSVNEGVASGLSPGSMGADMASRGALTPAQLGAASGVVTSGSGISDLSKVKDLLPKSTTSTTSTGTNNAGLLALAALLASQNKGGTDNSYQGTIPEYTFSRTQNETPKGQRPGQGGIDYFSPATYTKKAADGGLMGFDGGGESSQFDFAGRDNYPSMVGSGYPSRESGVDQGGIVPQTNPQFSGLGSLYQSAVPPQSYNMAQGGEVPGQYNLGSYSDGGRLLKGPGDGVSDSIPAIIGQKQPARLATGEFVIPARIVSELGNGSTEAGAQRLYDMMKRVQQKRLSTKNVAANTNAAKYLPA